MTEGPESKLIAALQTPAAVVTYRAVVGLLATITITLIAFIGGHITAGIDELKLSMVAVQVAVARNTGRIDSQDNRIVRIEASLDGLAKDQGAIDHRITVIESRRSH
jgi:hypothetical protein